MINGIIPIKYEDWIMLTDNEKEKESYKVIIEESKFKELVKQEDFRKYIEYTIFYII